ncbi:MAG: hypothetical protein PHY88_05320, partial [Candidatus Omnitrophica bacterium]|nr:hypothetical protein [Candidatus Omnitrophota bacterium]
LLELLELLLGGKTREKAKKKLKKKKKERSFLERERERERERENTLIYWALEHLLCGCCFRSFV